jgi:predicted Rossmann fold flavoprotein
MFPVTDNSETIIDCLTNEAVRNNVKIRLNYGVEKIHPRNSGFDLVLQNSEKIFTDKIIITTGGNPSLSFYNWLKETGHTIISPVPSLFTFNIPGSPLKGLEGVSLQHVQVSLEDFNYKVTAPFLITHWGISGPAVLKLSAFAARWLHEKSYSSVCLVNWLPDYTTEQIREDLVVSKESYSRRKVYGDTFYNLPSRLWQRICYLSGIKDNENWADINKSKMNYLVQNLSSMRLHVKGKTTFKEEFVTCGGVGLKDINMKTMESKIVKGIYFAGEVLDIDGVTGGFNFQAAWTTGYLAGVSCGSE